eukprot:3276573-Amphidinium_carterae.3
MSGCTHSGPLPWGFLDSVRESDHRPVLAVVVINSIPSPPRRCHRPITSFSNGVHKEHFETMLQHWLNTNHPAPVDNHHTSTTTPSQQFKDIHNHVLNLLHKTKPRHKTQLKPWITATTWQAMDQLNLARRLNKHLQHGTMTTQRILSTVNKCLPVIASFTNQNHNYLALALDTYISTHSRTTSRSLRKDKRAWFHAKCQEAADNWTDTKRTYQIVRQLTNKRKPSSTAALRFGNSSTVTLDPAQVNTAWLNHWAMHFQAHIGESADFSATDITRPATTFTTTITSSPPQPHTAHDTVTPIDDISPIFTEHDIRTTFKACNVHKACPDALHPSFWHYTSHITFPLLAQHFTEVTATSNIPHAYHGATIVPVTKKRGNKYTMADHRPI